MFHITRGYNTLKQMLNTSFKLACVAALKFKNNLNATSFKVKINNYNKLFANFKNYNSVEKMTNDTSKNYHIHKFIN